MPDDQVAENPVAEVTAPEATPAPETNTSAETVAETEAPVEETSSEAETTEETEPGKKSAQGRIKQLNNDLKEERRKSSMLEEKVNSILRENDENPFSPVNNPLPGLNKGQFAQPNENGEITFEDYKRDVQESAKATVKAMLAQQQMKSEAQDILRNTPELDPNSDLFDEELSEAITEAVESKHRLSSNFSLKETVEKMLKPYRKAAERALEKEKASLVSQVATAAVRPGPSPNVDTKRFEDLSIEEMEAKLGKVY